MGDIFGAAGSVASAAISANASKEAARIQSRALEQARAYVFNNLNPTVIGGQATQADVDRAKQRLALQAITDPALARLRYQAQNQLLEQAGNVGRGPQEALAGAAINEALASGPGTMGLRDRLLAAANEQLDLGATLPPDVQAELVQAGLEKAGMVTGAASPRGIGGTLLRRVIGQGALALQQQRQANAAALAQTASQLEGQRQQILGTLYPTLTNAQNQNLAATQAALGQSNQMVPEAGLGGNDIANIWLARVGAVNQLNQSAADVAARGAMAQAQAWAPAIGQSVGAIGNNLPNAYNTVQGWFSSPSTSSPAPARSGSNEAANTMAMNWLAGALG